MAAELFLGLLVLGCLFCRQIMTKDPSYMDLKNCSVMPCREFLFGTDTMGRDIFSMIWYGGRISLAIGLLSTLISTVIAVLFGAVSGCAPPWLDALLMRLTEIFLSVPNLLLVIFLLAAAGKSNVITISAVIGMTSWTSIAKVVRTEVRQIRNSEYVDKTGLIRFMNKCLDTPQKLICVSRPRRFGKSFATKMLCAYYSKGCDSKELFEDLQIAKDPAFAKNLNQYEVLYLDITLFLSTLKQDDMLVERMEQEIINDLGKVYPEVGKEQHLVDALCAFHERTEEKMILIIDEWDAMFRECKGQTHILDAYILLLRSLFKSSLTDQLFSGVYMTGILPIKKYGHESAVSDFYEYTMVDPCPLQEYIGFTETEVEMLCKKYQKDYALMQQWYDELEKENNERREQENANKQHIQNKPENTVTVTVQNKHKPQKEKDISNDNDTPSFDF